MKAKPEKVQQPRPDTQTVMLTARVPSAVPPRSVQTELRANAVRHAPAAAAGGGGATLTNGELLLRLRETQALLIKFSEENSRLSTDNQRLQAGRNALGVE